MTEVSSVTHAGYLEPELYRPYSIGHPLAQTECKVLGQELAASAGSAAEAVEGEPGELVMRGPQFMQGYWKEPHPTPAAFRHRLYRPGHVWPRARKGFYL